MRLFSFRHEDDFGHDFYIMIGRMKQRSLLQVALGTAVYGFSSRLSVSINEGALLSLSAASWKVYISVDLLGFNWRE
jgi:hypothetical protein